MPFKVVLHAGRPSPYAYPPVTCAKNKDERNKIIEEDRVNAHNELCIINLKKKVLTLPIISQKGLTGREPSLQDFVQTVPGTLSHNGAYQLKVVQMPGTIHPSLPQPGANLQPCASPHVSSLPKNSNKKSKQILTLARHPCLDVSEN